MPVRARPELIHVLIVLSTHGRTGLGKLLIGSVTEQVLRTLPLDLFAIPPMRNT